MSVMNPAPENLTPNAQLSVLEESPRPCRREHQPVELVIIVNAADEGKLASLQRKLADSLQRSLGANEIAKQLRTQLAESEAAVEVQLSRALALEEQVASLQARRRIVEAPAVELAVEASGMAQSLCAAFFSSINGHNATRAHLRRVYMLFTACTLAILLYVLFLRWSLLDLKADFLALKASAVSYHENCQHIAATCESINTDIWSHFSAQVAFAAWLRGLGLD